MNNRDLDEYIELISRFIRGQISAKKFEEDYLELFKSDGTIREESVFLILDRLFSDVDMYFSDPEIRGDHDLNDEELLSAAKRAYARLLAVR